MYVGDLLSTPALQSGQVVAGGDPASSVRSVHLAENASEVEAADPGSALVLTSSAAATVRSYRLDVLMSRAKAAGVPLVVLPCRASHLPEPAPDLAAEVCVLAVPPDDNVGELVTAIARELGGQDSHLVRVFQQAARVLAALADDPVADTKLAAALSSDAVTLQLRPRGSDVPAGWVTEPADAERHWLIRPLDVPLFACQLIVQAANGLLLASQDRTAAPDRTLAGLTGELLSGDTTVARELRHRAQALGFQLDGWHLVLALEIELPDEPAADLDRVQLEETLKRIALRELHAEAATWVWTHRGNSLLFVRTWTRPPNDAQLDRAYAVCAEATVAGRGILGPPVVITAGRSGPYVRADGLRRAASEARSAARSAHARTSRTNRPVVAFDEFGLERALIDWYLSESGTMTAASQLAPLTALPPTKSQPLLLTLSVYLDHQSSISQTADALFLHRNAVRHRIDRIKELLGTDLSDPDERLSLHLACRGWALTSSRRG